METSHNREMGQIFHQDPICPSMIEQVSLIISFIVAANTCRSRNTISAALVKQHLLNIWAFLQLLAKKCSWLVKIVGFGGNDAITVGQS